MNRHPRLVIAGTHSGVGKTTVTLAIMAALRMRGRLVQPFKVGPDFIDPGHHRAATGRPSRNLDGWMLGADLNRQIFAHGAADADISIIEGVMGLFDGSSPVHEIGSTAELAKQLDASVLLIIDGSAMARSAAAMVSGYARFDPKLRVQGVLFNRVSGAGHYRLLKEAVEAETDVAVVGYLKPDPAIEIADRHLGLVTAMERETDELYTLLGKAATETIDLDRIEALAGSCREWPVVSPLSAAKNHASKVRIGIAQDQAFCFYYPENLELLEAEGAELIPFSPLRDQSLPDNVTMLYLGGGYPELHGAALAGNVSMKTAIRTFAASGGAIYAECGGMMYLTQGIRTFEGMLYEMVGLFPAEATMQSKRMTLGYRAIELTQPCMLGSIGLAARGHEFHYSEVIPDGPLAYACALTDAQGESKGRDGMVEGNVLGLYTHLHFSSQPSIVASLVAAASQTGAAATASKRAKAI